MIRVYLKSGKTVDVPQGVMGHFEAVTKSQSSDNLVDETLTIRNDKSVYSGKVVATFRAVEVLGFTVIDDESDDTEETK